MATLAQDLNRLVQKQAAKPATHSVMLGIRSSFGGVDLHCGTGGTGPDTPFFIASVTKMFTATLIMQLIEEGRLTLDQTAQSLLPSLDLSDLHIVRGTALGPSLTVRQLLDQSSGLAGYYEGGLIRDIKQGKDAAFDLADVLAMVRARRPMGHPGAGRAYYSDTNFQLLGAILEAVTGQPYHQLVEDRICAPLGLTRTSVFRHGHSSAQGVLPLYYKDLECPIPLTLTSMGPDGAVVSTTSELLTFLQGFFGQRLFTQASLRVMQTWAPLFFPLEYGYGLMRFRLPRWLNLFRPSPLLIGHSGSSGSFAFFAPEQGVFLAGTFNQIDQSRRPFPFILQALRLVHTHRQSVQDIA